MEEKIAVFGAEKRYFWIVTVFLVFIFLTIGVNILEPRLFLFILFSVLLVVFFWNTPWILFALALASLPFGNIVPLPLGKHLVVDVSLIEMLTLLTFVILFLQTFLGHHRLFWKNLWKNNIFRLLFLYALLSTLSYFYIVDTKLFFFESRVIIFGLVTYIVARTVFDTPEKMRWFFSGLSALVLILALQVLFLLAQNGYSLALFYDRNLLLLPIGAIAFVSALLAVALPILVGYFLSESFAGLKLFVGSAVVLGFIALLLMLSKAAIGSFFLGMLYVVWKIRKKFIAPIVSVFGSALLILFLFSSFLTKLIERSLRAFVDVNSQYRILEYKLSGTVLHDHWLWGVGTGQQPIYFQKIYYADFINLVNNYLLQGWLDLGLVGLILLLLLTIVVSRQAVSLVKESKLSPWAPLAVGLTGSLIAAFFNGFAEVTFFGMFYAIVFAAFLGIMQNLKSWKKSQ